MTAGGISIPAPWKRRLLEYELLAPLPASLVQTLRLLKDQRSSVHDLIKVLQYDPAVTADILKLCNSPYYGLSRNVSSLKESLLLIGTNELHRMIHTLGYKGRVVGHGFRHTFSTILNDKGFNSDWVELQIAHVDKNNIRGVYNHALYMEGRRELMQWYADYIDQLRLI